MAEEPTPPRPQARPAQRQQGQQARPGQQQRPGQQRPGQQGQQRPGQQDQQKRQQSQTLPVSEQHEIGATQEDGEVRIQDRSGGKGPIICRQVPRALLALGIASNLLRRKPPFSNFNFGRMTAVIMGQIRRGHYLIAFRNGIPVGYIGWAVTSSDVAERWLHESYTPKYEECLDGDCCVLLTVYSESRDITMHEIRQARRRYPNHRIYFMRDYAKKKKSRKAHVMNVGSPS
jgi:hemolysin-activating ACP:hemolysin acyltransferase